MLIKNKIKVSLFTESSQVQLTFLDMEWQRTILKVAFVARDFPFDTWYKTEKSKDSCHTKLERFGLPSPVGALQNPRVFPWGSCYN